jgi:hypothetical protein
MDHEIMEAAVDTTRVKSISDRLVKIYSLSVGHFGFAVCSQ